MKIKIIKTIALPNITFVEGEIRDTTDYQIAQRFKYDNLFEMLIQLKYAIEIKENLYRSNGKHLVCASCITPLNNQGNVCDKCKFTSSFDKDSIEIIRKFENLLNKKD
jgi:predicted amidophosphoribosyltransferase